MTVSDDDKKASVEVSKFFMDHLISDRVHMVRTTRESDKTSNKASRKSARGLTLNEDGKEIKDKVTWTSFERPPGVATYNADDFYYHFFGDNPCCLLGAYTIGSDGLCGVIVFDIDGSHGRELVDASDRNTHAVDQYEALVEVLAKYNLRPLCCVSKSGTGFHVYLLFMHRLQPWKLRQIGEAIRIEAGLPEGTEVFPKQDVKGKSGNQVALPGGHWWNEKAKRRHGGSGSWLLDEDGCPVPFKDWPRELKKVEIITPEKSADLMKALRETGQNKDGKPLFDAPSTGAAPTPNTGERRQREPRNDAAPGDPTYEGWLPSDMEDFLQEHGFGYEKKPHNDGSKYILDRCPWNTAHTDPEDNTGVATFIDGSGVLGFKCHHAHCEDRRWSDFRQAVDPSWKRRQRECKGAKLTNIFSSSKLREEEKKAKRAAEAEERKKRRAAIIAEAEAKKAALRDGVAGDAAAPGVGPTVGLGVGLGVSAATRVKIAESSERMREPGEDEDVALEEALAEEEAEKLKEEAEKLKAKAEKLRQVRIEHRKKYVLSRAWRDHIVATSRREKYGLYSPAPRMGEVDAKSGEPVRPDDMTDEQDEKVEKLNRAHQHTRSCRAITKGLIGKSGKKKSVPYACDRSGCCVECAEESARDQAEWADEHWDHDVVTLVEARNDETEPRGYEDIEALRKAATKVVKEAEAGPKKPRKKRKKKGESLLGAEADAALGSAPEPEVKKEKLPWRYVNGFRRSVIVGAAELHEVIGAKFQPGGPKSAVGYAGDVVRCSESHGLSVVTSRVVTKAEAIKVLFGYEVGEDGKTDPTQFADWKSVWMEPSVELLARDRAGEKHLRTSCPGDPEGEARWEAELDRLTLRCFAHPYVQVKKKKRTSGNAPGRVAFSLPSPAELRAWKKERRARENPDLAQEPDEEYKEVEVRHYGKVFHVVHDWQNRERWDCANDCANALKMHLSRLGDPNYDIDENNRRQAAHVDQTLEEMQRTGHVRTRPAFGCRPPNPRTAFASAG